jgi:hypothetical protein
VFVVGPAAGIGDPTITDGRRLAVRFSIQGLFALIAVAAVFMGALTYRTPLWASIVVTVTLGVFTVPTCRLLLNRSPRAFTLGFCLTGWLYLAVVFIPFLSEVHRSLLTTRCLGYVWESLKVGERSAGFIEIGGVRFQDLDGQLAVEAAIAPFQPIHGDYYSELRSYFYVGECLSAIVLATLTGVVASYGARRPLA